MASTFGSLEIAKSGMMVYNASIQTTAHNIANVETKGYSKQTVNTTSLVSNKTSVTVQGAGVNVVNITRNRNEYYDTKYQNTQSTYNKYKTESYYLTSMEDLIAGGIVSDDQATITSAFDEFYAALSNLRGNPNNMTIRTQAVTLAETFTEFVGAVATNLQQLQEEANTEIKTCVDQINALAEKIVAINKQINITESYGSIANDLRDQRSLLVDELAQFCNVEVQEKFPSDGVGEPQFYVYINGGVLVDTYISNPLVVTQKESYSNINDVTGCYDVSWADGTGFSKYNSVLGGKLEALFAIRDGNNGTILDGEISSVADALDANGHLELKINNTTCENVQELNIPAHDGEITINNHTYTYESFSVEVDDDGKFEYTFLLKDATDDTPALLQEGAVAHVGTSVNAKGIPYVMAQLNEFVRTFSQRFNEVQNQGYDLNSELGVDFFNATVPANGANYIMQESVDGKDPSFSSIAEAEMDAEGNEIYKGSYYYITALNFCVTESVASDPGKLAAKGLPTDGSDNGDVLQKLTELKDDSKMFIHGAPDSFIQSLTSTIGVNSAKAATMEESQSNLLFAIDSNRKSVSGVDEDEEGSDLIIFQNMLMNQYKVLQVMNEVLDKLINGTV